jgi:hypothetical protein
VKGVFEVCVHPEGFVYEVVTERSTSLPHLDAAFVKAALTWRYAPLVKDGKPVAFCHPLTVVWRPVPADVDR